MADDALKFKVDLVGNMLQELVNSGKAANTAEGNINSLTAAIVEMSDASAKKGGESSFFVFDIAKGADLAIGLVSKLATGMLDLGRRIVDTAAHTQDLNVAIRQTAGPENVDAINAIADSFGDTRFDDDEIKKMILPLLEVGLNEPGTLQLIATAATDIAARNNNDPAAAAEVVDTFKRIQTKREVNEKILKSVGVNEKDFYVALGETLGKNAKTAESLVKAGKIKAEDLQAELLGQIAKRQGGSLGVATDESAKTLSTTLARLENLPDNLFKQLADSPGLALLQERVDRFVNRLSGPDGARIVEVLGGALDRISGYLFGDERGAEKFITAIETGVPKLIVLVEKLSSALKYVVDLTIQVSDKWEVISSIFKHAAAGAATGAAFGTVVAGVGAIPGAAIGAIGGAIVGDINAQKAIEARGEAAAKGLADGMRQGAPLVTDAANELASCATTSVDSALEIHSPSRVLFQRGQMSAEGLASGLESGTDRVESAARQSLADSVLGGGTGRNAGGSSMTVTYAPTYQITGGGDVASQVQRADEQARAEFGRLLDEARSRFGAAA